MSKVYTYQTVRQNIDICGFNVTNHDAFHLVEQGAAHTFSPLFGQGRIRQSPRAAQLTVRFVF